MLLCTKISNYISTWLCNEDFSNEEIGWKQEMILMNMVEVHSEDFIFYFYFNKIPFFSLNDLEIISWISRNDGMSLKVAIECENVVWFL